MTGLSAWAADFANTFYKCFIREDRYKLLISGIGVTIRVSLIAVTLGILIGLVVALCNLSNKKPLKVIGGIYTDVIRGTPSVTQLMIIYFVIFATVNIPKWIIAGIAFGINSGAYVSEIIRAGILSVDKGQTEAGRSLGLNGYQTMIHIVIPQAVKNILPTLGNEFIALIKETSVVSFVGAADLYVAFNYIGSNSYEFMVPYLVMAVIYIVLVLLISLGIKLMERSLRKSDRRN